MPDRGRKPWSGADASRGGPQIRDWLWATLHVATPNAQRAAWRRDDARGAAVRPGRPGFAAATACSGRSGWPPATCFIDAMRPEQARGPYGNHILLRPPYTPPIPRPKDFHIRQNCPLLESRRTLQRSAKSARAATRGRPDAYGTPTFTTGDDLNSRAASALTTGRKSALIDVGGRELFVHAQHASREAYVPPCAAAATLTDIGEPAL